MYLCWSGKGLTACSKEHVLVMDERSRLRLVLFSEAHIAEFSVVQVPRGGAGAPSLSCKHIFWVTLATVV